MSTLLICNAQVVNEGRIQKADVLACDGRIARIDSDLSQITSDQFIDASGLYLLPGMIDSQFGIVGEEVKPEILARECQAAVVGGVTSVLLLPDLHTESHRKTNFSEKQLEALGHTLVTNFSYYQAVRVNEVEDLSGLSLKACCGLYADMADFQDEYRFDEPDVLQSLLENSPIIVAVHAESAPLILGNEESYRQVYGDKIPFHLHSSIRNQEVCSIAADEVLRLAKHTQANVHLLHISSDAEVELLAKYRAEYSNVSADVCSQFLVFTDTDSAKKGTQLKYCPAIKTDIDRAALIQGLLDGNIDNICTGHIPIARRDKEQDYLDVPSGLPQAQFAMPAVLEHFQDQILSLELIVEKTSHAVADRFSIGERGYIREGYWADLILVDIDRSFIARNEDVISSAGWTVYNGSEFRSSVHTTIVNGQVAWRNNALVDGVRAGQLIDFAR
ncbi:MAG: dihydroorotase [Proteobacteria bacterium]|nr:MAG: dihydroorotase [Pseudomonadota bacterium]